MVSSSHAARSLQSLFHVSVLVCMASIATVPVAAQAPCPEEPNVPPLAEDDTQQAVLARELATRAARESVDN